MEKIERFKIKGKKLENSLEDSDLRKRSEGNLNGMVTNEKFDLVMYECDNRYKTRETSNY